MNANKKPSRFTKMSSYSLLKKVSYGKLDEKTAREIAAILERRFPTPIRKK